MNNQQRYIQKIKEVSLVTLQVANLVLKQTGEYKPGYRYDVDKYELHDERNVLLNEIVFDFDWSSYVKNYAKAKLVIESLENRKIPYYIYATGGKGIHIHIYFNKINAETDNQKKLLKEATSYGFIPKHVRMWFWNTILNEAGIEENFRKKYVDPKVVKFNYFAGTSHLIRDCGGRKIIKKPDDEFKTTYKTYIPRNQFNSKKVSVTSFDNVVFPESVETFDIDMSELSTYLKTFVEYSKNQKQRPLKNEYLKINYREIDGVLKIREGLDLGNRGMGAFIISVACKIDKLPKKDTKVILEDYVNKCTQSGHKFNITEAEQWMDWVYSQESVYWNCSQLKDVGVHDEALCEFCQSANKEANEFLTSSKLIKIVKDVLDIEIVGEDDIKILIFLLLLSKDFPSETGKNGWNVLGDPISQNVILASDSSSGKTYVAKRILKLFGEEDDDYFVVSRMSKSVINYYTDINMDGKIIFVEEMQGLDENTSQLRVWMSEGKLKFDTVEKVKNEEGVEVNTKVTKVTKGQPCFLTCQAEGTIGDQLNNRSWLISLDVSSRQTKKILEYQSKLNRNEIKQDKTKIRIIKDALKQLKPYHFIIEFVDEKFMKIPVEDVRARRDFQKFLTLIKCVAYLHQKQREIVKIDDKEFIKCSIEDYDIARQYSHNVLGATFTGLTIQQIDIISLVKNSSWKGEFTVYDLQRNFGKSHTYWHGQLNHLENLGYVTADKSIGKTTNYMLNELKSLDLISLPTGEELMKNYESLKQNEKLGEKSKSGVENVSPNSEVHFKVGLSNPQIKANESFDTLNKKQKVLFKNIHVDDIDFSKQKPPKSLRFEDVLNFIKSQKEHLIYITDIEKYYNQNVDNIISIMKKRGLIYEPVGGRVMIL